MNRSDIRVLLMRAPGTNCDAETVRAFRDVGVKENADVETRVAMSARIDDPSRVENEILIRVIEGVDRYVDLKSERVSLIEELIPVRIGPVGHAEEEVLVGDKPS